jgi:hypothetical protein
MIVHVVALLYGELEVVEGARNWQACSSLQLEVRKYPRYQSVGRRPGSRRLTVDQSESAKTFVESSGLELRQAPVVSSQKEKSLARKQALTCHRTFRAVPFLQYVTNDVFALII